MELTYKEIATIKNKSIPSIKMYLSRIKIQSKTKTKTIKGVETRVSVNDLIAIKYITQAQIDLHFASIKLSHLNTECNSQLASAIIRKGSLAEEYSEEEIILLEQITDEWQNKDKKELLNLFCAIFKKSRSWFYLDHNVDKRTLADNAYDKLTIEQKMMVDKLFLSNRNRKKWIDQCKENEGLPEISRQTWYRIGKILDKKLRAEKIRLHQGAIAMKQAAPFVPQDFTGLKPLELIVGDGWRVDRIVWWGNELITPTLIAWMDVRTKMFVGFSLSKHENSLSIKTALFYCFLNYGIPDKALMDLGKSFRANRIAGNKTDERIKMINEIKDEIARFGMQGILPSLGVEDIRAGFKSPNAKPIERQFGRGGLSDWAKDFADWSGSKYWNRPEIIEKHRKMMTRRAGTIEKINKKTGEFFEFCDITDLAASLHEYFDGYHNRPSQGFGMDNKSPLQLWNELTSIHPPKKADINILAWSFLEGPQRTKKIRLNGYLEFKKHMFYFHPEQYKHTREDVFIRYNPIDGFWINRADQKQYEYLPKKLLLFDERGKFLCESTYVDRMDRSVDNPEKLKQALERKNSIGKCALEHIRELENGDGSLTKQRMQIVQAKPHDIVKMNEEEKEESEKEKEEKEQNSNPYRKVFI